MLYTVTLRNQFKALEFTLFLLLCAIVATIYLHYSNPAFHLEIIAWAFLIQFLPVLFLHVEYLTINSGSSLLLDKKGSTLKYVNKLGVIHLDFDQIARVVLYLPPSAYRGQMERKMQFLPIEPYGYAVIYSKEGDRIIATSLIMPDIIQELGKINGIPIDKRKRLFASPFMERMFMS